MALERENKIYFFLSAGSFAFWYFVTGISRLKKTKHLYQTWTAAYVLQ